jgi:hypothetical protein
MRRFFYKFFSGDYLHVVSLIASHYRAQRIRAGLCYAPGCQEHGVVWLDQMTRDADLNFSDLITLEDACKHFLGGKVTVATLRALHKDREIRDLPDRSAGLHHDQRPKRDATKMPRRSSGPKLWFDERRERWTISDGKSKRRTNCRRDEIGAAEKELAAYIAEKHTVDKTSTAIADILMAYIDEVITGKVSEPDSLMMIRRLNAWWGDKFIADITPANCKALYQAPGRQADRALRARLPAGGLEALAQEPQPDPDPDDHHAGPAAGSRALADQIRGGPVPLGSPPHPSPRPVLYYRLVHWQPADGDPQFEVVADQARRPDHVPEAAGPCRPRSARRRSGSGTGCWATSGAGRSATASTTC